MRGGRYSGNPFLESDRTEEWQRGWRELKSKAVFLRQIQNDLGITETQLMALMLFHGENTNKGAARVMGLSSRTMEVHRKMLIERMGCRTLVGAVLKFERAMVAAGMELPAIEANAA